MLPSQGAPRPFRSHILRSFVAFASVLISGAAILIFATNKLTEDHVMRQQLTALSGDSADAGSGIFVGALEVVPQRYRARFADLAPGHSELEVDGRELQVLRTEAGGKSVFAAVVLSEDGSSAFFLSLLLIASIGALLLAYSVSRGLARRFSAPVERIAARLHGQNQRNAPAQSEPLIAEHIDIVEFALLRDKVDVFQREQALRIEREVGFARSVSHELRTPLAVIEGVLELHADGDEKVLRTDRLGRIRRATANMRMTVETLLALTRAEQKVITTNGTFESELDAIVAQRRSLVHAQVILRTAVTGHPQAPTEWCSLLIALQTLLDNAIRHTPPGTITIEASTHVARVTDTGDGMSHALCQQLQSGEPARDGIGYPLVRRICKLHGWGLSVASDGKGTRVSIELAAGNGQPQVD